MSEIASMWAAGILIGLGAILGFAMAWSDRHQPDESDDENV